MILQYCYYESVKNIVCVVHLSSQSFTVSGQGIQTNARHTKMNDFKQAKFTRSTESHKLKESMYLSYCGDPGAPCVLLSFTCK